MSKESERQDEDDAKINLLKKIEREIRVCLEILRGKP